MRKFPSLRLGTIGDPATRKELQRLVEWCRSIPTLAVPNEGLPSGGYILGGGGGVTDHGALTGLSDDDHAQYLLLAGRTGGQTAYGGLVAGETLKLYANAADTLYTTLGSGKLELVESGAVVGGILDATTWGSFPDTAIYGNPTTGLILSGQNSDTLGAKISIESGTMTGADIDFYGGGFDFHYASSPGYTPFFALDPNPTGGYGNAQLRGWMDITRISATPADALHIDGNNVVVDTVTNALVQIERGYSSPTVQNYHLLKFTKNQDEADPGGLLSYFDKDGVFYGTVSGAFIGTLPDHAHAGVAGDGGVLAAYLLDTDIGVTVQAYDADTAKLDVQQSWTAQQTFPYGDNAPIFQQEETSGHFALAFDTEAADFTYLSVEGAAVGGVVGFPAAGGTVLTASSTANVTNKTLTGLSTIRGSNTNIIICRPGYGPLFRDYTDATKQFRLDASAITTATIRQYIMPDANGTVALNPMTAAGDMVIGGASGVPTALPASGAAEGDVLGFASGAPAWKSFAELKALVNDIAYPVGSVYTAVVSTNPNTLLGVGTWAAFGAGRVLVGIDSGDTDFDTVEETGGAKTVAAAGSNATYDVAAKTLNSGSTNVSPASHTHTFTGSATSVVQPYIVVYMWKRTA